MIRLSAEFYFADLFSPALYLFAVIIIPSLSTDNFYPQQW